MGARTAAGAGKSGAGGGARSGRPAMTGNQLQEGERPDRGRKRRG